jgi:ribonuclease HII
MRAISTIPDSLFIAGVDEAGRGPLAGPVVASAVILPRGIRIEGLTARQRERLAGIIRGRAVCCAVAWADRAEIDALNILGATLLAMQRAVLGLRMRPCYVAVDGNRMPNLEFFGNSLAGDAIVGGDATVPAISAASILAKTVRDRMMLGLDAIYPGYDFAAHKGYPTSLHRSRLQSIGASPAHRRSFAPVSKVL